MFRARFAETLPKSLPNFGPQELERDVVDSVPGDRVEHFLCALLGLLLNRKQDVKYVKSAWMICAVFCASTNPGILQGWPLQSRSRRGGFHTQGAVGA
jgi:hypothetical protein